MQTLLQWSITENPFRLVYYIALYQIQSVKNPWNLQFLQNTVAFPHKRCTSENISQLFSTGNVQHWKIRVPKKDPKKPVVSYKKEGNCECGKLNQIPGIFKTVRTGTCWLQFLKWPPSWLHTGPNPGYFKITFIFLGSSVATSSLHLALHSNSYAFVAMGAICKWSCCPEGPLLWSLVALTPPI